MQRTAWLGAILLLLQCICGATAQEYRTLNEKMPCFSGVAQLRIKEDECGKQLQQIAPLSAPFDPSQHLPWDCLERMAVSVEGCMVHMVSLVNMSEQLFNFSCSWIQFQGLVTNETTARLDAWLRPRAVMRYILKTADLTAASNEISTSNRPKDWQLMLEDAISSWGAVLLADKDNSNVMVLSQNDRRCKTTFEITSGGLLGVGQVNRTSLGEVIIPSMRPYRQPVVLRGERSQWWRQRARAVFIALIVMVSVFGFLLLLALGFLFYRLFTAGKGKNGPLTGSPFEDGLARMEAPHTNIGQGVSSLENQSRRHGLSGGI